jgi:hypothetical protein
MIRIKLTFVGRSHFGNGIGLLQIIKEVFGELGGDRTVKGGVTMGTHGI